jgi:hypothetical protein
VCRPLVSFLYALAALFILSAAVPAPTTYKIVINPAGNGRDLFFKGRIDGMEIKGWWLDITVDGQVLEDFLESHPNFRFVLNGADGKKVELGAADYLKTGIRFPAGGRWMLSLQAIEDGENDEGGATTSSSAAQFIIDGLPVIVPGSSSDRGSGGSRDGSLSNCGCR